MKPVTVKGKTVKVNFWDLSGQPEFFEIRNEFYKNTQGVRRARGVVFARVGVGIRRALGGERVPSHWRWVVTQVARASAAATRLFLCMT